MKIDSIRKRENVKLCELNGDLEGLKKSKKELKKYLKSKDFNNAVKKLEEGEQRLVLISEDKDYTELLTRNL